VTARPGRHEPVHASHVCTLADDSWPQPSSPAAQVERTWATSALSNFKGLTGAQLVLLAALPLLMLWAFADPRHAVLPCVVCLAATVVALRELNLYLFAALGKKPKSA